MKSIKMFVVALALFLLVNPAMAQNKKKSSINEIPTVVIVMDDDATGGPDEGLTSGLGQFIGVPLKVTEVKRSVAMKDPKYQGLDMDFMPIYLLEKNAVTSEKFAEPVKAGQLKELNGYIVFEHQTRRGVYASREMRPNEIDLFVMSQCPYGVMAENKIIDIKKLGRLPENIKVNLHYIVGPGRGNQEFSSLHGAAEWEEDVRQIIIKEKYPTKFWKYLEIRNKNYQSSRWDIAAEEAGINPKVFRKYWDFGVAKLKEDMKHSEEYKVSGSPTVIWQGRTVTDMNSLGSIPGLEAFGQNYGGGAPQGAPQGQC